MKRLSELVRWFLTITACILIVVALNETISGVKRIPSATLWQIVLSGFLTAFVTMALGPKEGYRRGGCGWVRLILHYLALCAVMILCGWQFGWVEFQLLEILMMMASVAVVYILVGVSAYLEGRRLADAINRKLAEKREE